MTYFSEKEEGERSRENEEIGDGAWGGIKALITARINDGSFGAAYPNSSWDGGGPTGTDAEALWQAMRAEISNFQELQLPSWYNGMEMPRTLDILHMIEFCWRCVGKPIQIGYHKASSGVKAKGMCSFTSCHSSLPAFQYR
ncbi:hypothetical protein GOD47_01395 [Sinorhizobium medicae]|nr:hypothetical protein [Sinorhizobium medicae]MDX0662675.1 hypothetical protein [Sinorhizobium medicae]MDX0723720.1 hypothetical protein [Sinorhizobium medicae]MDX0729800.1 hypothetical protein [Sinorhizobium medicae]MDX0809889.1 hypothetical protein [Sinorhizobium medicae]